MNIRGRVIQRGPRGGEYVLDEKGRKVYKFKRATRAPPPSPLKKVVPARVAAKLLSVLKTMKKRRAALKKPPRPQTKRVILKFEKFKRIDPTLATKNRQSFFTTVNVHVPEGVNTNAVLAISDDTLPMQKWLDDQSAYIRSLSERDYYTAMAYTVRSHEWIGPWVRGDRGPYFSFPSGHTFPLFHQIQELSKSDSHIQNLLKSYGYRQALQRIPKETLDKAMDMYVKDLQRIIRKAPPLPRTMYVYRGVATNIFRGKLGEVHTLKEFASAGYIPQYAYASDSYLRIKLLKGTRVLLLQGLNQWRPDGEFEVLLNKGSRYVIRKRYLDRYVFNRPNVRMGRARKVTDVTVFSS